MDLKVNVSTDFVMTPPPISNTKVTTKPQLIEQLGPTLGPEGILQTVWHPSGGHRETPIVCNPSSRS